MEGFVVFGIVIAAALIGALAVYRAARSEGGCCCGGKCAMDKLTSLQEQAKDNTQSET